MKKFLFFLIFIILILKSSFLYATTYYVADSGGSNSYNGLYSSYQGGSNGPWKTVQYAADNASNPGDIVYIRSGTYTENVAWDTNSGTTDNYITFENYTGESPEVVAASGAYGAFHIEGVDWIKIKGIIFDGDGIADNGFCVWGSASGTDNIWLENNTFENSSAYGCLHIKDNGAGRTISNVTVKGGVVQGCAMEGIYTSENHANGEVSDILIEDVEITNTPEPIQQSCHSPCNDGPVNVTYRGLNIHDNNSSNYAVMGIGDAGTNTIIEDCMIYDNGPNYWTGGIYVQGQTNPIIRNNLLFNNDGTQSYDSAIRLSGGSGAKIYHNTIYGHGGHGILESSHTNDDVRNNIVSDCTNDSFNGTFSTADYNICYNNGSDCSNTNDQNGDPLFVNTGEGSEDFHIQSGSSAQDTGTDVGVIDDIEGHTRPMAAAYDVGAFEYTDNTNSPTAPTGLRVISSN